MAIPNPAVYASLNIVLMTIYSPPAMPTIGINGYSGTWYVLFKCPNDLRNLNMPATVIMKNIQTTNMAKLVRISNDPKVHKGKPVDLQAQGRSPVLLPCRLDDQFF